MKTYITLETALEIEVSYFYQPAEPGNGVREEIQEVSVINIENGDLEELCYYIASTKDFYKELSEKIMEEIKYEPEP